MPDFMDDFKDIAYYGVNFGLNTFNQMKCKLCQECNWVDWEHYWDYIMMPGQPMIPMRQQRWRHHLP